MRLCRFLCVRDTGHRDYKNTALGVSIFFSLSLESWTHSLTKTRIYHSIPLKEIASHLTPITDNGDDDDDDKNKLQRQQFNDNDDYDDHVNNDDDNNSEDDDDDDDNSHVNNIIEALLFY